MSNPVVSFFLIGVVIAVVFTRSGVSHAADPPPANSDRLAAAFADLLRDAIPLAYERKEDWGQTKRIPVGIENTGHGLRLRLRKREKEVKHGVWKHYKITQTDPEEHLRVRISDLRNIGPSRIALTLHVTSKLHGWAQTKIYNRGLHIIALTAEGDSEMELAVDCEVGAKIEPASFLASFVIDPVVTDARLTLHDFRLNRLGELRGSLARELGNGLRRLIEDELEPQKLTAKLNRAIDKKRDRLQFSPDLTSTRGGGS